MGNNRTKIIRKVNIYSFRTDNSVKNHFFAKIRKSMRKMNKIIKKRFKKELKVVKLNVLYKILEAS